MRLVGARDAGGRDNDGDEHHDRIRRAIATDPAIILADEPTGQLESETTDPVLSHVRRAGNGARVAAGKRDRVACARRRDGPGTWGANPFYLP